VGDADGMHVLHSTQHLREHGARLVLRQLLALHNRLEQLAAAHAVEARQPDNEKRGAAARTAP
jgi:hypothetical protein